MTLLRAETGPASLSLFRGGLAPALLTQNAAPVAAPVLDGNTARWRVATEWRSPQGAPLLTKTRTCHLADNGDTLTLDLDWHP